MRSALRPATIASLLLVLASAAVDGCGSGDAKPVVGPEIEAPPRGPAGPVFVGTTYTDARGWIEYQPGDAPLLIIAPHGGTLVPAELPDRACSGCVTGNDLNTQELAREVMSAFVRRTGARPHLVVNRLHRRKFDGNREQAEATGGTGALAMPWIWLQAAIDTATGRIASRSSTRGMAIDLHGHGHAIPRIELGYLLTAAELRRSDAAMSASNDLARSSIARLAADARSGDAGSLLLRGPNSLGGLLEAAGYASVPSPATPAPLVGEEYFNGGFNTARVAAGGAVDAIQIETHFTGVRENAATRAAFADALAASLVRFLERQYGWKGPLDG